MAGHALKKCPLLEVKALLDVLQDCRRFHRLPAVGPWVLPHVSSCVFLRDRLISVVEGAFFQSRKVTLSINVTVSELLPDLQDDRVHRHPLFSPRDFPGHNTGFSPHRTMRDSAFSIWICAIY